MDMILLSNSEAFRATLGGSFILLRLGMRLRHFLAPAARMSDQGFGSQGGDCSADGNIRSLPCQRERRFVERSRPLAVRDFEVLRLA